MSLAGKVGREQSEAVVEEGEEEEEKRDLSKHLLQLLHRRNWSATSIITPASTAFASVCVPFPGRKKGVTN